MLHIKTYKIAFDNQITTIHTDNIAAIISLLDQINVNAEIYEIKDSGNFDLIHTTFKLNK